MGVALRAALEARKREALAEKDDFVTYQVLEREVETNRHLYNGLLQRLDPLRAAVKQHGTSLGLAFDGDADRCAFVDEAGETVHADLITAILARGLLERKPGAGIIYDLRSSKILPEEVTRLGGRPVRERVGHSFMKETMRKEDCVVGGELSGHFYFADNFTCDSGMIAMISALNLVSTEAASLSELTRDLRRYHATGEINFRVDDKDAAIATLRREFEDGRQDDLDGITVEFGDLASDDWWWFNVRASNTESVQLRSRNAFCNWFNVRFTAPALAKGPK